MNDLTGGTQRWAASVEYLGSAFSGWQIQDHRISAQAVLQDALSCVAAHPVSVVAAGRTDAGVHGLGQVVHFDSDAARSPYAWLLGCNTHLPETISLRWVQPVPLSFSARFSATLRRYRYIIHNQRARSALLNGRVGWWKYALEAEPMHAAAQLLVGVHDFSAYRDSQCQAPSPVRRLLSIGVQRRADFVVIDVCGYAFLHHMVRNIVGVLVAIGQGIRPVSWAQEVLESKDRRQGGITMPAEGLYFLGPEYPPEFALPAPPDLWFPG